MSKKSNQFSPEVRERAIRMVRKHRGGYPSLWVAIESITPACATGVRQQRLKRRLNGSIDLDVTLAKK